MKSPDTTEVVEKFLSESARRSQRSSVLLDSPSIDLSVRNDSEDVRDGRLAEARNRATSSFSEYEPSSPSRVGLFSARFEEFLAKYKSKTEPASGEEEVRVPLGEL